MKQIALLFSLVMLAFSGHAQQCQAGFTYAVNGSIVDFTNTSTGQIDWVSWDFGDGNTSGSIDPTHTYASAGTYLVCLTYIDSLIGCSDTYCDTITIQGGSGGGCNLSFSLTDNGGTIVGSNASSGAAYYEWYIWGPSGMVGPISGANLSYAAPTTGNYSVCLYGYDSLQVWCDSTCQSIFVQTNGGGGCNASFNLSSNGSTISATNTSTGNNAYYTWDVFTPTGYDGPFYTTDLTYNATQTGNYTICVSVYDSLQGWCDSTCQSIFMQVGGGGCSSSFNLSSNGNTITGTNTSSGGDYYEWYIYTPTGFDGPFYTTDLTYSATQMGNYTVCLSAYDSVQGWCDSTCQSIYIQTGGGGNCQASFYSVQDTSASQFSDSWYFVNTSTGSGLDYMWDFGDGNSSTQENPFHTYASTGTYLVCLTITSQQDSTCYSTTCDSIVVLSVGQAEYLIDESSIELYPNPVENQATLNMFARSNADVTITIYSSVGQLVDRQQAAVREGTNTVQLQTANLNSGIYLVEVSTDNSKNVIRFVKR